jgi:flagellar hook assembly protein FlgD
VTLAVHDLLGRRVRLLYDEPAQAGYYRLEWDGRDDGGRAAGSGVYFYLLRGDGRQLTRKMIKVQ